MEDSILIEKKEVAVSNEVETKNEETSVSVDPSGFITGFDVLSMTAVPTKFFVENLIPLNSLSLLSGPSDTGKSIFARQIAIAVATGKNEVAGFKLNVKFGKVIYISTEDSIFDWKDKLDKYGFSKEDQEKLNNLSLLLDNGRDVLKQLEKKMAENPVDLVVIDVFSDLFDQDLNNSIHIRRFLSDFSKLANRYGCTMLFVHHLSKKGEAGLPSKANVLGSQGIESRMRSVLELRVDESDDRHRYLAVTKSNYLKPSEKREMYKMLLKPTLEFEYTGQKVNKSHLVRPRTTPIDILKRVLEMSAQGTSVRKIEEQLRQEGHTLGKSRINEIIKQDRRENNR